VRKVPVRLRQQIEKQDDRWVQKAELLTKDLGKDNKERQLRNIQNIAETSESWKALALFVRYQAARGYIDKDWTERAIALLESLEEDARVITGPAEPEMIRAVHMELVSRVMGYAVRCHVSAVKG